jgi:hypothetical protein
MSERVELVKWVKELKELNRQPEGQAVHRGGGRGGVRPLSAHLTISPFSLI